MGFDKPSKSYWSVYRSGNRCSRRTCTVSWFPVHSRWITDNTNQTGKEIKIAHVPYHVGKAPKRRQNNSWTEGAILEDLLPFVETIGLLTGSGFCHACLYCATIRIFCNRLLRWRCCPLWRLNTASEPAIMRLQLYKMKLSSHPMRVSSKCFWQVRSVINPKILPLGTVQINEKLFSQQERSKTSIDRRWCLRIGTAAQSGTVALTIGKVNLAGVWVSKWWQHVLVRKCFIWPTNNAVF